MTPIRKAAALVVLLLSFAWDLFASTWAVARIVLAPGIRTAPGIVVMTTGLERPWAVALLAYFTSLTPGSTCLHVSDDRRRLYLHLLDVDDPEAAVARYRRLYEKPIAELER